MRVLALLLLALVATVFAECSVTIPATGKKFTFKKLASTTTSIPSSRITGVPDGFALDFRFCGTTDTVRCQPKESAVCLHKGGAPQAVPGFWDADHLPTVKALDNGVSIHVEGLAQAGERVFTTTFNIKCGSATEPTAAISVADFVVSFSHPEACGGGSGGSGGLSGGWIFLIILMVTTVVYIIAGCIFMHKRRGTSIGLESCPNKGFWTAIPGLTKDGCAFTVAKIKGCFGKSERSGGEEYESSV